MATVNPYQVFGPTVPAMLGRAALVNEIEGRILKDTPDHVSIVGPAHYGKSVFLSHLAEVHRTGSSHYLTTVYIDFRYSPPASDATFKRRLASELRAALRQVGSELSGHIDTEYERIHELLDDVFADLAAGGMRVLVVLDGFDHVLAGTGLTRNLWDQLRELARRPSLRLVTGSRRRLRELCRTREAQSSNFWGIFHDPPSQVAALDDSDWESLLLPLQEAGCTLDGSARKEAVNWTGGVPVLVCALLQELWEAHDGGMPLSKSEIDAAAAAILNGPRESLSALWDDCDDELRADLGMLASADIPLVDLSDDRRRAIESRGFGSPSRNRLRGSCRLMQRYAQRQAPATADLKRLFGTASGFETHVMAMLELRLDQIARQNVDGLLHDHVSRVVRDMDKPEIALDGIRRIARRALALIWDAELPPDKTLPLEWVEHWKRLDVNFPHDEGKLPDGYGPQCGLLRLVTGSGNTRPLGKCVTKTTCLLVDHLQSVGNFGQHREEFSETTISIGFVASSVLSAISLVENLTADLHRQEGTG